METTLPDLFVERLRVLVDPADWPAATASFHQPKDVGVRLNTLVGPAPQTLAALDEEKISFQTQAWFEDALRVPWGERDALTRSDCYASRAIYVQNPSSMLPVLVLDPRPGEEVLDLCAAPGSKTLQLAAAMTNEGRIAAVERARPRFFRLKANVEAYGARIVQCYGHDGRQVWKKVGERFDRVLLDAPCSSESRFRSDEPETFKYWGSKKIRQLASVQKQLLESALRCLKPGGVLVYATCSFAPEENEAVVDSLLRRYAGAVSVERIDRRLPNRRAGITQWQGEQFRSELGEAVRIAPDDFFDGFFLCRLRKHESTANRERP